MHSLAYADLLQIVRLYNIYAVSVPQWVKWNCSLTLKHFNQAVQFILTSAPTDYSGVLASFFHSFTFLFSFGQHNEVKQNKVIGRSSVKADIFGDEELSGWQKCEEIQRIIEQLLAWSPASDCAPVRCSVCWITIKILRDLFLLARWARIVNCSEQ